MQQTDPIHAETADESTKTPPSSRPGKLKRRLRLTALIVLVLLGLALLPPLVNVSRFQRRIASSISGSLGRPVHLDRVSLSLLPLPGFVIENLVVDEDPAFGAEPIIRANTVRATLRLSSLWRGRVEFSTISFTENTSVNLVHLPDGRWNIESVLLQASHIDIAPTVQRRAGPAPRFPYIEATGARLNFKQSQEKLPFSLIESEFALWAPNPDQWRIRLTAKPARTDANSFDTGTVEMEGTLGRGDSLAHIPVNLEVQWKDAPLGEASRVLTGEDEGWRGSMLLDTNIRGTLGESAVTARLQLSGVRRADFIPQQTLSADAECFATALSIFHSFQDLRCSWPPNATAETPTIALTGEIPDIRHLERSIIQFGATGIPASTVVNWLRIASSSVSESILASGTLTGGVNYDGSTAKRWSGQLMLHDAGLKTLTTEADSLLKGDVALRIIPAGPKPDAGVALQLASASVVLGGRDPANLEGRFDDRGYTLHLTGMATRPKLQEFVTAISPLGEGLMTIDQPARPAAANNTTFLPARIDRTSAAAWNEPRSQNEASLVGRK